ncbi:MAG: dephospho-CoA kinase [Bacilli bacterium]
MSSLSKKVIGITGNIACGKSLVIDYIHKQGYHIIDSDLIVKQLYQNNQDLKLQIMKMFDHVSTNNELDFTKLGQLVFNDDIALNKLNQLIHPLVYQQIQATINNLEGLIFVDIPLLFEASFESLVDIIILVYASKEIQLQRLMKRNQLSMEQALNRMNKFIDQDIKKRLAHYIIDNSFTTTNTYHQVDTIINNIKKEGI